MFFHQFMFIKLRSVDLWAMQSKKLVLIIKEKKEMSLLFLIQVFHS